jgi:hypothetical protein
MPDNRTAKKIFQWNPLTKRSQGKPKYRWEVNIKQDICQMKVKTWIICVQDRGNRKRTLRGPKRSVIKGSSAPEEKEEKEEEEEEEGDI